MERRPKTIFQLDSPFTAIQWPETSPQDQDTILELLISILSPIGQYKAANGVPSKGKRSKKRKRKENKSTEEDSKPPVPEISSFVVIGLNSITRSLESLSQKSKALRSADCGENDAGLGTQSGISDVERKSDGQELEPSEVGGNGRAMLDVEEPLVDAAQQTLPKSFEAESDGMVAQVPQSQSSPAEKETAKDAGKPLIEHEPGDIPFSAIFVPSSSQPSILRSHLPQLITTASLANPDLPATKLVQLPKGCEDRLCKALGLPRVSFIGLLEGAPHSKSLVELIRECVPEIEIPWLREVKKSEYLPVKINAIETFVTVVQKGKKVA